ncbi:MAG: hypothetical protein II065_05000, partial [Bacteroidaceae bacterium]|nr:hypothetical protein [Bacteroidaceae bacterium]
WVRDGYVGNLSMSPFFSGFFSAHIFVLIPLMGNKTIQLHPVSVKTKYLYVLLHPWVAYVVFLPMAAVVDYLITRYFVGDSCSIAITLLTPMSCLNFMYLETISLFFVFLFRSNIIRIGCAVILVLWTGVSKVPEVYEFMENGMVQIFIFLLVVVLNVVNYKLFKRCQPANNGLLMI